MTGKDFGSVYILAAFVAAVIRHLRGTMKEELVLAHTQGYSPLWWGRHGGRGVRQPVSREP